MPEEVVGFMQANSSRRIFALEQYLWATPIIVEEQHSINCVL
jgi:hypothetical protein